MKKIIVILIFLLLSTNTYSDASDYLYGVWNKVSINNNTDETKGGNNAIGSPMIAEGSDIYLALPGSILITKRILTVGGASFLINSIDGGIDNIEINISAVGNCDINEVKVYVHGITGNELLIEDGGNKGKYQGLYRPIVEIVGKDIRYIRAKKIEPAIGYIATDTAKVWSYRELFTREYERVAKETKIEVYGKVKEPIYLDGNKDYLYRVMINQQLKWVAGRDIDLPNRDSIIEIE